MRILPHAYDVGWAVAAALWPFFGRRRRLSIDNVLRSGITSDPKEAARIAKRSWCHFAGHICEAIRVPAHVNASNWREHIDVEGASPRLVSCLFDELDTPILLVSGHHGAWEAATNILSITRPMIAIVRVMNNRFVAKWMKNHHFRGPVTLVDKNRGFRPEYLRQWESEKSGFAILVDQYAYRGELLRFMGRPARTVTSATRLAMRYAHPVAVGSFVRIGPYRYRIVGGDPVVMRKDGDLREYTQLLNDRIEECVRRYPDQYLWAHRRWRDD